MKLHVPEQWYTWNETFGRVVDDVVVCARLISFVIFVSIFWPLRLVLLRSRFFPRSFSSFLAVERVYNLYIFIWSIDCVFLRLQCNINLCLLLHLVETCICWADSYLFRRCSSVSVARATPLLCSHAATNYPNRFLHQFLLLLFFIPFLKFP